MTNRFLASENYLDPDVGYLLGMIVGRGSFTEAGEDRRLVIDFPFRALRATGIDVSYDQQTQLQLAVVQIRNRIENLVEAVFDVSTTRSNVCFVMRFVHNSMTWRNLRLITDGFQNFRSSTVPQRLLEAPEDIQREFVRGLADVCGFVRTSNRERDGRHRVYIEIPGQNWQLPVSLCHLLQVCLHVPVQMIQWNHPNTRIPFRTDLSLTSREHQVKIFADMYRSIGFYVNYKQTILDELADYNEENFSITRSLCNPNPEAHQQHLRRKPAHPEENCQLVTEQIRGSHFDAYWQICTALDCTQHTPLDPNQRRFFEDNSETVD
jgi:hypothetical protein